MYSIITPNQPMERTPSRCALLRRSSARYEEQTMKIIGILTFIVFLSSCATYSAPNFFNGKYYMAGDDNCRYMRQLDNNRIMCQDSSHKDVGYREAMTDQQLQMYMHQQSIDQANSAMILNSLQQSQPVNCTSNAIGSQVYTNCR